MVQKAIIINLKGHTKEFIYMFVFQKKLFSGYFKAMILKNVTETGSRKIECQKWMPGILGLDSVEKVVRVPGEYSLPLVQQLKTQPTSDKHNALLADSTCSSSSQ